MIRLLIADDHEMIRKGLHTLLQHEPDLVVETMVASGEEAVDACAQGGIDVVLMDLLMPGMGGVAAIGAIKLRCPQVQVLAVTINDEKRFIREAIQAGAAGYILKHSTKDQILEAIHCVSEGRAYFSSEVAGAMSEVIGSPGSVLTPKEQDVLRLVALELSNQELADRLGCSLRTIDTHKRNISRKLGVRNMVGLIKYAIKEGYS
jgi:DNA-binding NarL/FixJ family response regulator